MNDDSTASSGGALSPRRHAPLSTSAKLHVDTTQASWPVTLQYAHDVCQRSPLPMSICWGKQRIFLYNDAWRSLFDAETVTTIAPSGSNAQDIYGKQWDAVELLSNKVIESGESIRSGRQLFDTHHRGAHDGFYNYSLQPLYAEHEQGILVTAERSFEEVERFNDDFLATIAHELRNPFGALAAAAQVLNRAVDRPEMMATAREALTRQVDYLSHLLDDLLDLSRLRRGTLPLRAQPVALKAVINAAIEASKPAMENKQHSFTVEEVATTLHVNGDKSMLIRIFSNLLKHVARHTESGRLLQLQIKPHNFGVDVIVKNTGFVPEKIQRALEDFMQKKFTRQPGRDLDISLSLICGLVQLNAGQISAYGNATGNGSDIVVYLPGVDDNAITA